MAQAKKGDRVRIDFTGTLEDGTIFDSTLDSGDCESGHCDTDDCGDEGCGCETGPMELVIGEGEFFEQIEEALIGMAPGEKKTLTIPSDDAFGDYDESKVFAVPREQIPDDLQPEVGEELVLTDEEDEAIGVTVVEVADDSITFDANHPLAGEDLTYEFTLVEIL
ncbi:MAG: peptidylprolyl isomerase [Desulfuromonadales bacterium]|uniref:FKBP-type peptidyl-prolyl cis-trans isomerase n=1 Tax=Desulfuromonas sp. KJ2020 TaxID=2919173 RepID=UPI0003219C68|nr:peptidylprolyl isomerase [Desulfuromonas sp. KJ2020]MCP3176693.1 peptidylprolyl isomerase [Desulfuromonas sp. KJ2020]